MVRRGNIVEAYEELGAFYLGRRYEPETGVTDEPILYDAKDLTTHAVCVGMTGSGKSGLGIALIEEAAIDGVPVLVIDPKGDMGNLLLTFPDLQPESFAPWIDPADAARNGNTPAAQAKATAKLWRDGLASWNQDGDRIGRFAAAAERVIYTPGSTAGRPLSILQSFRAPGAAVLDNPEILRERVQATVSGLLALVGVEADPLRSREHILLANIVEHHWRGGMDLDLAGLIRAIQSPPFQRLGVLELDAFFPAPDRMSLALALNNLLASPGFSAWSEGEPLSIPNLLYAQDGRPRVSILSIAHLNDAERISFVTLLLGELIAWMRTQPGSRSLRALLYMDEIYGYFPPVANPPTKQPMLTLLKQARAFGVGAILATQNPVDLDYKGLANAGTWFIGRLQTQRDKERVLEGLEGAAMAAGGRFNRALMEQTLAGLGSRVFLLHNVHEDAPVLFHTRWVLSYLAGPLTREQIRQLQPPQSTTPQTVPTLMHRVEEAAQEAETSSVQRPILPAGVEEGFLPAPPNVQVARYRPALLAECTLHYSNRTAKVDEWKTKTLLAMLDEESASNPWETAEPYDAGFAALESEPAPRAAFSEPPAVCLRAPSYKRWEKMLKSELYRSHEIVLLRCNELKLLSEPGESESEFRGRLRSALREQRDELLEKLRKRYSPKLARLEERIRTAEQRVEREQSQYREQQTQAAVSVGATVLGALFGRKLASSRNVGRAASTLRRAGRVNREKQDIALAEETLQARMEDLRDMEAEFQDALEQVRDTAGADELELQEVVVRPRKSDIAIDRFSFVWVA